MKDTHFKDSQLKMEDLMSGEDFKKFEADEKDPDDAELNTIIEDVWVDFSTNMQASKAKLEAAIKDEVNERLREYLKQNSQHLSGAVEKHVRAIDTGRTPGVNEKITSLSLLSYERQEFLKAMGKVRLAFRIELRDTKHLAVIKSREMFLRMYEDMKKLFKAEYSCVVDQYN
jgi:LPS O-antigen subunit length determinant protein (WzzB/FepE family)